MMTNSNTDGHPYADEEIRAHKGASQLLNADVEVPFRHRERFRRQELGGPLLVPEVVLALHARQRVDPAPRHGIWRCRMAYGCSNFRSAQATT